MIAAAIFLFWQFGKPLLFGSKPAEMQPYTVDDTAASERAPEQVCTIDGAQFDARLSSRSATLQGLTLKDARFVKDGKPMELVAPLAYEPRMPLRTDLRIPGGAAQQVPFDDLDWKLTAQDGKSCTFAYTDDATSLTKTIRATGEPYQLAVTLEVKNLASEPRKHRLSFEQGAWQKKSETEGHLGRQSELLTETMAGGEKTDRQMPSDFDADAFKKKEFTAEHWRRSPGEARFVAVNTSYFSKIAIPLEAQSPQGAIKPSAETVIEDLWSPKQFPAKDKDPNFAHYYRARLLYPDVELKPQESAKYEVLTFNGPKDRNVLAKVGHGTTDVLNLGTFAPIARALIQYLYKLHDLVGSWGIAIILMTMTVRTLLFPLSLTQIKSSIAMRKLKPEMDAINEKYKDDATQRGLAIQELWRKNKVTNPVLGCLPMLLQLPVWWALYSALQTAVELYHTPFLWFADLSAPDRFYIVPVVLGASSFIQQKLMPPQGDPQQQKMMMYMMPAVFTFMMLFLPSGLGVYMLTNTWLGIGQQLLVERYLKARAGGPPGSIEVREKTNGGGDKPIPALGKGKARARG